jgi:acetate---CoA ligase (ADP-forming)
MTAPGSLTSLFRPGSIAVVGASRNPRTVGGAVFHNLLAGGFTGAVYPVNPNAPSVQSVKAWPRLEDLPEVPELVVVAVPPRQALEVVLAAANLGTKAAVILTAGFGETGPAGRELELKIRQIARGKGMRVLGPNCLGVLTPDPAVRMNATFGTTFPPHGNIAFASQSGAIGLAAVDLAADLGIGISAFASLGNKADISGNDVLEHFEHDPQTRTLLLYLESFGNPARFREIATRVARSKPIVLVKSGRSGAGARAAGSHTGSMAGPDASISALCRQTGVIRAETMEQLFDVAALLAGQPLPRGRKVAVVTNAGGPGILAADAIEGSGLSCPPLSESTQQALRAVLRPAASVGNPVDILADADAVTYGKALEQVARDPEIDAVIAMYVPPITGDALAVAREITRVTAETDKPVLVCFAGTFGVQEAFALLRSRQVPCYRFPEAPARALALAAEHAEWRRAPEALPEPAGPAPKDAVRALEVARQRLGAPGGWLSLGETETFARAWDLPLVTARRVCAEVPAVVRAAASLSYPVVLKADVPGLIHKSDVGAVALGLDSAARVEEAAQRMLQLSPTGFLVQSQVMDGEEWIVGAVRDPVFGPLVTVGAGGTRTELVRDVHQRLAPLSATDVDALMTMPRVGQTLGGWRGDGPLDGAALAHVIRTVGRAACGHPEITDLELNPVKVRARGQGAVGLDLRIHLGPETP